MLMAGGALGVGVAMVHAVIGQRRILQPVAGLSPVARRVLVAVFHLSTLYWGIAGLALVWGALVWPLEVLRTVGVVVIWLYLTGAIANFWATRGKHFGWVLLVLCGVLIGVGLIGANHVA